MPKKVEAQPQWWKNPLSIVAILAAFTFLLQVLFLKQANGIGSDEGVHVLSGLWMLEGFRPYSNFYYSHPPLVALTSAWGVKIFGSMYAVRVLFLLLNCISVLPLYAILSRITKSKFAAVVAIAFYLSYPLLVHHDWRFVALREVVTLFLILFVWAGFVIPKSAWSLPLQLMAAIGSAFTFLPSSLSLLVLSLAMIVSENSSTKRRNAFFDRYAVLGMLTGLVLLTFFILVPQSFHHTFLEHFYRINFSISRTTRMLTLFSFSSDLIVHILACCGLLMGALQKKPVRGFAVASLVMIGAVFLPKEFHPHYFAAGAIGFAIGIAIFVATLENFSRLAEKKIMRLSIGTVLALHLMIALPVLLTEWIGNRDARYQQSIQILRTVPEPVLTLFDPIPVIEAKRNFVHRYYLSDFRTFGGIVRVKLTATQYQDLAEEACSIVLTERDRFYIPLSIQEQWMRDFQVLQLPGDITLLLTKNEGCK